MDKECIIHGDKQIRDTCYEYYITKHNINIKHKILSKYIEDSSVFCPG